MTNTPRLITSAYCLGLVLSVAANVVQYRTNLELANDYDRYRNFASLEPGMRLPELSGVDGTGAPITVGYNRDKRRTLLLVFSPFCRFSTQNWPNWSRLVAAGRADLTRIVAIDLTGEADTDYVRTHGLLDVTYLAKIERASTFAYNLRAVPTTMLLSPDGRVERLWTGPLGAEEMEFLEKAVQTGL